MRGNAIEAAIAELLQRQRGGRASTCVEAHQLALLRVPDDGEQVAAHAVPRGLDQSQQGVGRDGRIHSVPAALQHVQGHLRRQGLAGGRHAVARDDFTARGEGPASDAVLAEDGEREQGEEQEAGGGHGKGGWGRQGSGDPTHSSPAPPVRPGSVRSARGRSAVVHMVRMLVHV